MTRTKPRPVAAFAMAALLAMPAAAPAADPVKVTRFHIDQPIAPGTITVEMAPDATVTPGPEADLYKDAVAGGLQANGFTRVAPGTPADYRVVVNISRSITELPPAPPPVSIGLGGGGGDNGFGLGGSVAFGVGKRQPRAQVTTQISVRIQRAADTDAIWEGRASQTVMERGKLVQPGATADKLSKALFKGFPGESGRTISVK